MRAVEAGAAAPGGLEAVLLANRAGLLRFLRARGAGEDAEDVLQELWLKVPGATREPVADPLAYLYRMANNAMLDRRRAERRRLRRERDWIGEDAAPLSGEAVLLARSEVAAAGAALAALGGPTAAIFRRFRIDGVRQQEIAREMGMSLSAVEKHLQRAYRALVAIGDGPAAERGPHGE